MANPFVAEIRIFPFNFAPKGWAKCDGQLLPISQNTALFSLLGTYYGGDGRSTFGLPNLQGSAALHWGQGPGLLLRDLGESGGTPEVTLLKTELPAHTHNAVGNSGDGSLPGPVNNVWAGPGADRDLFCYDPTATSITMAPAAVSVNGGSLPHNNYMPYLGLMFCIAMQGVFPPRG
jgi:microcystin-dependent protein